jgi:hypothetical protein
MSVLDFKKENADKERQVEKAELRHLRPDETVASEPANEKPNKLPPKSDPFHVFVILGSFTLGVLKVLGKGAFLTIKASFSYLRYHPFHALLTGLLVALLGIMVATSSSIHANMILGEISNETVEDLIEASRYTRTYSSVRLGQRGAEEFLRVGAPDWAQREGVRAILFHARRAGLSVEDQAVLLATAEVESGFNPMAKAPTTTACGLFQFVRATGSKYGLSQADCMNPSANAKAGIAHYLDNYNDRVRGDISGLTGAERVFKLYELSYYLHHDGPNSSNPSNMVKAVVLDGTEFLFRAYRILLMENLSKEEAPSFLDRFSENLFEILHQIAEHTPFWPLQNVEAQPEA